MLLYNVKRLDSMLTSLMASVNGNEEIGLKERDISVRYFLCEGMYCIKTFHLNLGNRGWVEDLVNFIKDKTPYETILSHANVIWRKKRYNISKETGNRLIQPSAYVKVVVYPSGQDWY